MAWGGETFISTQFQLQLREAALELRDARAKRRDLGLALVVALGVFGLLAEAKAIDNACFSARNSPGASRPNMGTVRRSLVF